MTLTVEASVRTRQSFLIAIIPMDVEPAETVHTLKLAEAVERHFAGTGHKLEKLGSLFFVE